MVSNCKPVEDTYVACTSVSVSALTPTCICTSCHAQFIEDNLAVMSVGFLLASPEDAVIWRGPKKNGEF